MQQMTAVLVLLLTAASAQAGMITTNLEDVTNGGGFFGQVTFKDTGNNEVTITADISSSINPGITRGDIIGLWFDLADTAAIEGLSSSNRFLYDPDSVGSSVRGPYNLNGSGETDWDLFARTGLNGAAGGFNQIVTITLTALAGLSVEQFENQRVGMRVMSIRGVDGFGDSAKLISQVPEPGTLGLLGIGLLGLALQRRRQVR
jgi:hypothetical protein